MSNDFLTKVKETEQKATEIIESALKRKNADLLKYKQELAKKREKNLTSSQEKMKNELQKTKIESRKNYEEFVLEGKNKANELKSEKINMLESLYSGAEKFLLELI